MGIYNLELTRAMWLYEFGTDLCIFRPLVLCLAPSSLPWPQYVFPCPGPQFVFTSPGTKFVVTGPGPQFLFNGPSPKFVFTSPGPRFVFAGPDWKFAFIGLVPKLYLPILALALAPNLYLQVYIKILLLLSQLLVLSLRSIILTVFFTYN